MGFPGGSDDEESACNAGDLGLIPELGRCPREGNGSIPVSLPGEFHGQRNLVGYSQGGCKESDMTGSHQVVQCMACVDIRAVLSPP